MPKPPTAADHPDQSSKDSHVGLEAAMVQYKADIGRCKPAEHDKDYKPQAGSTTATSTSSTTSGKLTLLAYAPS